MKTPCYECCTDFILGIGPDFVCGSRKVQVDDHDIGTPAYPYPIKVKTVKDLLGSCLRMSDRVLARKGPVATA
jgi:hypothetical protein